MSDAVDGMSEESMDTPAPASAVFFPTIPIEVPLKMVMMRLGYRNRTTVLSPGQREKLERTIAEGFSLCRPTGCWRRIAVAEKKGDRIVLQDGSVLAGVSLAALLHESSAVALMASTVGTRIVEAASDAMAQGDGVTAVIYDAVGGQSADAAMNWINTFIRGQLSRRAERLTAKRFSPGYGDLSLESQTIIHSLLDLSRLGIALSSRYMLVPEKSVTAIAGIENAR
ncbi:MAG: hypothetical protein JXA18_02000 [Chitinispirillaceae bacterium]|nr:hypothetical protein [Chitinispirillaceae bacterium]